MNELHPDVERVLIPEVDIRERVAELGAQISCDYADTGILLVGILKGAFVFMSDLVRSITCDCSVDFMTVSSYGNEMSSSGVVRIRHDVSSSLEGRHVIICEDIVDTGLTLKSLLPQLQERGPASIEIAAFAVKDIPGFDPHVKVAYAAFHVPPEFIVGYGLDYAQLYRNLPYVGVLKPEVYS